MGKINQGVFGEVKGKVGNLVGCTWKGIPYMRTRPAHMTNPRTASQQNQRGRFSIAMNFLRPITPFIRYGYQEFAKKQTPFNAAMSYLMKNAFTGEGEDLALDYNKVLVMHGTLTQAENAAVTLENGCARFTWDNNSGQGNATEDDAVFLLVYNKERNEAVYETAEAMRPSCKAEMRYPQEWKEHELAVYLGFCNVAGKGVSNSICLFNGQRFINSCRSSSGNFSIA